MVQHSRSKTKQEALEQSALDINKDMIYFTTDDHTIVMGGEEYSKCKVGNLDGYISQDATFLNRTTAGSISIAEQADGDIAQMTAVRGNSLVWNQLVDIKNLHLGWFEEGSFEMKTTDTTITVTNVSNKQIRDRFSINQVISVLKNHKYYVCAEKSAKGVTATKLWGFYPTIAGESSNNKWFDESVYHYADDNKISDIVTANANYEYAVLNLIQLGGEDADIYEPGASITYSHVMCIDLSLMYGIGNEPDKATFEQWLNTHYPHGYYEYNKGEVISVKPTGIKTVGFNLYGDGDIKEIYTGSLHELYNERGSLWKNTVNYSGRIHTSLHYDIIVPNKENRRIGLYIIYRYTDGTNSEITGLENGIDGIDLQLTSQEGKVVDRICLSYANNGTITISKICINFSDPERNGQYEEHWSETTPINVTSLVGTKSDGTEEIMFPDGLMGIGEYKDEIKGDKAIKRIQKVDLGSLTWTKWMGMINDELSVAYTAKINQYKVNYRVVSDVLCKSYTSAIDNITSDINIVSQNIPTVDNLDYARQLVIVDSSVTEASQIAEKVKGVDAYIILHEPIEYTLKTPFSVTYKADDYGTEQILPDNGNNTPLTLPIEATIKYGVNVLGELENLPYNYVATYPQNLTDLQKETARHNIGVDLDRYAEKNGTYLDMTVGNAVNLEGGNEIVNNSAARPTGGNEDVTFDSSSVIKIEGNSVAWNQLAPAITEWRANEYQTGGSVDFYGDEVVIDANGVTNVNTNKTVGKAFGIELVTIPNHKYLYTVEYNSEFSNNVRITLNFSDGTTDVNNRASDRSTSTYMWNRLSIIASYSTKYVNKCYMHVSITENTVAKVRRPMLFDLTLIYGAGKEPTTVEQFEMDYKRWFGRILEYENYSEGIIRPTLATGIKTTGFNLSPISGFEGRILDWYNNNHVIWDNAYGYQGEMCIQFGLEYTRNDEPTDTTNQALLHIIYTDYSYEHLYVDRESNPKLIFKTNKQKTVKHIKSSYRQFPTDTIKITNFCINFSWSGKRDGEYEPHWEDVASLPITTVTGKLNGEGESVVVFPDGMKRAGDVRDEIFVENGVTKAIKRVGSVDLGTLDWAYQASASGDSTLGNRFYADNPIDASKVDWAIETMLCSRYTHGAPYKKDETTDKIITKNLRNIYLRDNSFNGSVDTLKSTLKGVLAYYTLEEPQVYTLNFSLPVAYRIDDYGTEEIVQPYDSIAPSYISTYGVNAVDTIRRLPKNYVSVLDQLFTEEQKATARRNIGAVSDEYYNELLKWHSYNNSVSSTTSVSTIPVNARLCIVNTTSGGTFGGTASITKGQELHVIINNNGSSKITVNIPSTYKCDVESIDIEAGKFGEVNCITDGISIYCRAIGG